MALKDRDQSRLDGRLTGQTKLVSKDLQIVQPAQARDPAQLQRFNGHGLAHMHPLPLCIQNILQLLSSILGRLRTMKATIFICIASQQILSWFIINICNLQPSSNLPTSAHTCTHACMDARKHIHMVLAPTRSHNALHSFSMYNNNRALR